jgi:cytochrome o ubiquinol oxidase subunit II
VIHRNRISRIIAMLKAGFLIGILGLSGCEMDVLHPEGPVGARETYLLVETSAAMLIVVIPVFVMTFLFAWRYRAGASNSVYEPTWSASKRIEIAIWGIPLLIIIFLGIVDWRSTHKLDPFQPLPGNPPSLTVDVVALDWKWLFIYPGQHIATVNQLVIPTGTQIAFKITSASVMNVFFIPQLGTQIYAMSGMQTQVHLLAKNAGTYRGLSANFSGPGFPDMRFATQAVSNAAFQAWVSHIQSMKSNLTISAYQQLAKPNMDSPVAYFGAVDADLFQKILTQYAGTAAPPFKVPPPAKEPK